MPRYCGNVIAALRKITASFVSFDDWLEDQQGIEFLAMSQEVDQNDFGGDDDWLSQYEEILKENYDNFVKRINPQNSAITVYRCVRAPSVDDVDTNELGIYWTDQEDLAECYHGFDQTKGKEIILKAVISSKDVLWDETLLLNITAPEEAEIRLVPGTQIEINHWRFKPDTGWTDTDLKGVT